MPSIMKLSFAGLAALLLPSLATPIESRAAGKFSANFDKIPNGFVIQSPYQNLNWNAFLVASPDRNTPSYVKYDTRYQYGRVYNGTEASIERPSNVSGFLITSLKYACSEPTDNLINAGTPAACKIKIREYCNRASQSRTLVSNYNPTQLIAPMQALDLTKGQKCTKGRSYTFQSNGPDILIDTVKLTEYLEETI